MDGRGAPEEFREVGVDVPGVVAEEAVAADCVVVVAAGR